MNDFMAASSCTLQTLHVTKPSCIPIRAENRDSLEGKPVAGSFRSGVSRTYRVDMDKSLHVLQRAAHVPGRRFPHRMRYAV